MYQPQSEVNYFNCPNSEEKISITSLCAMLRIGFCMVALGISNSRLKDFYDIWYLCHNFEFEGDLLSQAIKATFERRKTSLPTIEPLALTVEFAEDTNKKKQWQAFLNKGKLKSEHKHLAQVTNMLRDFLMPPCLAATKDETFNRRWYPSNGWQS